MATKSVDTAGIEPARDDYRTELGFLILALAQLVSLFAVWFGYWPRSFGMTAATGQSFSLFFLGAGVLGFFLAFRTLSLT